MAADKPNAAAPQFPVVDQVYEVPIADIAVGERLRPIDPVWAEALGAIMDKEGQRTPIEICRRGRGWQLVSGGHRLEGRRLRGHTTIKTRVVDGDHIAAREQEISENLWRKGLDPIDRATFVAELMQLQKLRAGLSAEDDGRVASAHARWGKELKKQADDASVTMTLAYGFAEGVAEKIGLSRKTIYRDLELHRGLLPDVVAKLRGTAVSANAGQLRALAKLSEADQRAAADLIASGACRGAADAVATLRQKPKTSPETKAWSAFFGGWNRMSTAKRHAALRELAKQGMPKGVRLVFDDGDQA